MRDHRREIFAAVLATAAIAFVAPSFAGEGGHGGACRADRERLCADAPHERGAMRKCMRDHQSELSDECKQAMAERHAHWQERHHQGDASADDAAH